MPADLDGLPIAITGASSGIGAATARACAAAGMPVALAARRLDRLESLAHEITDAGGRAVAVECDVTNPEQCGSLVERTVEAFGSLHAVFANAGYGREGAVLDIPDDEHRAMFETNFWGTLNTIRPAVERMRPARRGHVLICSSCLSKIGVPHYAAYCATKSAQDIYGRALRFELADDGIDVSTVHPVATRTEFDEINRRLSGGARLHGAGNSKGVQTPERVADAIVRCLRRPRSEVWTSPMRYALALSVALPEFRDRTIARKVRKRLERSGAK